MTEKRYYWLKLKEGFFDRKEVKKLRRIAGGDTYTVIYMKLLLLSLRDNGVLYFDGVEETFEEELALALDEDVENVKVTISYLLSVGLMELVSDLEVKLTEIPVLIGSESWSAERMRRLRDRQKKLLVEEESSHCDGDVTRGDEDKRTEEKKDNKPSMSIDEEFDSLWELYPRKQGKKDARNHYKKVRKKGVTYEAVRDGIEAYKHYAEATKTDPQFLKYGSTFFSQESWLDDWSVPGERKPTKTEKRQMSDDELQKMIERQMAYEKETIERRHD